MRELQEIQIRSLGFEDPLEKEMATHSRILAWKIPWLEKPGGVQSMDSPSVGHDLATEHTGIGELMRGKGGRVCFLERQRLAVAALTLPRRLLGSWLHADSPHLGPP